MTSGFINVEVLMSVYKQILISAVLFYGEGAYSLEMQKDKRSDALCVQSSPDTSTQRTFSKNEIKEILEKIVGNDIVENFLQEKTINIFLQKEKDGYTVYYDLPKESNISELESTENQDSDDMEDASAYIQLVLTNLSKIPTDAEQTVIQKETSLLYDFLSKKSMNSIESIPLYLSSAIAACARHLDLCCSKMQEYIRTLLGDEKEWDSKISELYSLAEDAGY